LDRGCVHVDAEFQHFIKGSMWLIA
jgi:hypothetical protein